MNILLIHQYYLEKNEGGGVRWNEMTRMWSEKGHTITVIAGMSHYTTGKKAERYKGKFLFTDDFAPGIKVIRCHVSESYNVSFGGRLWAYFSFVFSSIWAGLFKAKEKYDTIIVTSPPLFVGFTAYVLSRLKRVPFIFEIRDLWPESAIDTGVLKNKFIISLSYWFESFIYKKAKLINVLTPAFRDKLIEKKKVPANKIVFIPNAADFSLSDELSGHFDTSAFRKEHHLNGQLILTYVGAHGVANHLIQVLDTAELLKDEHVLFLLIGDGMEKKMLQEEASNRSLKNVRFINSVPKKEVFKYILASDIGLSVLKDVETFKTIYSNKTFDYMSCRKPILLAIDGVSRQLVEEANAGTFVLPENPADFASKVKMYLNNRDLIAKQGENGYQYAKKHFDRTNLAAKYIRIISEQ